MSRFVVVLIGVATLAVGAAVGTFLIAPPEVAPLAVASAFLTTVTVSLAVRGALVDRPILNVDVHGGTYSASDHAVVEIHVSNSGRRPIRVEEIGWSVRKGQVLRPYPYWMKWSKQRGENEFPATLAEADSLKFWTWPVDIARWMLKYAPPTWLFVTDHAGNHHWYRVPADTTDSIRAEVPKAREQWEKQEAERKSREAEVAAKALRGQSAVDDYGQPIDTSETPAA